MSDTTARYVAAYRAAYRAAALEIRTIAADIPDPADIEEMASAWRSPRDAAGDAVNDLVRLIADPREERDTIELAAATAAIAAAVAVY